MTIACSRVNTLTHRNRLYLTDTWIRTVLSLSADSDSTILLLTMDLTEHISPNSSRASCTRRRSVVPILGIRDVLRIFSTSFTTWWSHTHVVVLFLRSEEPWRLFPLLDSMHSLMILCPNCVVASDHVEAWRLFRLLDSIYDWRSHTQNVLLCLSPCGSLTSLTPSRFDWRSDDPRRLHELPILDQKRVCTSTCQSLRERRALDIKSRCRSCLLAVYIRLTTWESSVFNVEYLLLRMIWPSRGSDVYGVRVWFGSKLLQAFCTVEVWGPSRKMICSRISICHLFWSLVVFPTVRITSPLMIAFHSRGSVSRTVMSFWTRCPKGHSTRGLCSFISHWSLHDPFVEFRKFVTPTAAVETPRDSIFLFCS